MSNGETGGMSLIAVLLVIFVVLKLTNNIDWGWAWVLSPLWIPICVAIAVVLLVTVVRMAAWPFGALQRWRWRRNLNKDEK